ncbi:MAG: hypothetical protein R2911_10975 [Caldilineaceae bacterium]
MTSLLLDLRSASQVRRLLPPLSLSETAEVAAQVSDAMLDAVNSITIWSTQSEGNPLFIVEMVRGIDRESRRWRTVDTRERNAAVIANPTGILIINICHPALAVSPPAARSAFARGRVRQVGQHCCGNWPFVCV